MAGLLARATDESANPLCLQLGDGSIGRYSAASAWQRYYDRAAVALIEERHLSGKPAGETLGTMAERAAQFSTHVRASASYPDAIASYLQGLSDDLRRVEENLVDAYWETGQQGAPQPIDLEAAESLGKRLDQARRRLIE